MFHKKGKQNTDFKLNFRHPRRGSKGKALPGVRRCRHHDATHDIIKQSQQQQQQQQHQQQQQQRHVSTQSIAPALSLCVCVHKQAKYRPFLCACVYECVCERPRTKDLSHHAVTLSHSVWRQQATATRGNDLGGNSVGSCLLLPQLISRSNTAAAEVVR